MKIGKLIFGAGAIVGGIVLAPVVVPVAASAGAAALATAGATAAAAAGAVGTAATAVGTAAASTAVGSAVVGSTAAISSVATAATTAVAGSAVGSMIGGGMAAVGGVVGSAAGAVGLSSVATVTGTSAGATAVGAITTSGAVGVASAASGAGKITKASRIASEAQIKYRKAREQYDITEKKTNQRLEELGNIKIGLWEKMGHFSELFKRIRNIELIGGPQIDKNIELDVNRLEKVDVLAISAKSVIRNGAITLTASQLVGVASATGITSMATASTGTAIASLHGVAAYNASMAALGGGSLSAGGLGMAGGAIVANALVFAPAIAVGGLFLNGQGSKSLKEAEESFAKAESLCIKMKTAEEAMKELCELTSKLISVLTEYESIYDKLLLWLNDLVNKDCDAAHYSEEEVKKLYAMYCLTTILYELTTKKLFSTNDNSTSVCTIEVNQAIIDSKEKWSDYKNNAA